MHQKLSNKTVFLISLAVILLHFSARELPSEFPVTQWAQAFVADSMLKEALVLSFIISFIKALRE